MISNQSVENLSLQASQAKTLLEESEARFRRLFETAQDGILLLDAETGKITEANAFLLDLLGYAPGEVLGKKLWELGFLKDVEAAKAAFAVLQRTGYVRYDDLPLETKDGRNMEVEFISNVYLVGARRVIQCNIRDISERKRLDHLKDDFLSTISHEIRTPISNLIMGIDDLEVMRAGKFDKDEDTVFEILKRNAAELEKTIKDLLDLSRFESGKMGPALQSVKIDSLIVGVLQEYQSSAKGRGLDLKETCEKDLPLLSADPDLLERILTNLLDNAFRFAKSKITVNAHKNDFDLQISVNNDGPKIKPENIPAIFNKFIQINRPKGGSCYKGTGLGLAICSRIAELHGGKIWTENSNDGGVRFVLSIPWTRGVLVKEK